MRLINYTNIALFPKVESAEAFSNFRPFCPCNVSYKIITKVLCKRLKPLLDLCIYKNQGVLAPSRSIQDNILIAHELFSNFKRRKRRTCDMTIKLDVEKAYDMLNWDFIMYVILKYGFSIRWVNLIMKCITSTCFSIVINGCTHGYLYPKRGIRQGDPLSLYIFILCMELLIRHLNSLTHTQKYTNNT